MSVRKAMVFHAVDVTDVDNLVNDKNLVFQQKFDGTRALCVITTEMGAGPDELLIQIEFLSRSGAPLKHTAATQHLGPIRSALALHVLELWQDRQIGAGTEIVLDGELMIDTGEFVLFDMPYMYGDVNVDWGYLNRYSSLMAYFNDVDRPVRVSSLAQTSEEKRALYEAVVANNGEGVMAKHISSPYDEGKRVKHSMKCKFWQTADVVVMDFYRGRDGKNAAGEPTGSETGWIKFGVYGEDGELVHKGRCSIIGKPEVWKGAVIEVKYLCVGAGGALVQPTMLRNREDRTPESCTLEQFEIYSKAIL
jgi:hypothetical protein